MSPDRRAAARPAWWIGATMVLAAVGGVLVRHAVAEPAIGWMRMYSPADFPTTPALVTFLLQLRVPIPPVIAALEIINFQHSGSTDWVTAYLYRVSLVGTYVVAVWLSYPSLLRLLASIVASIVFLWATTLIHPINPQVYDPLFPFFVLLFLAALRAALAVPPQSARLQLGLSASAGFFLSMAELTRPFVFLFLPFLLAGSWLLLQQYGARMIAAFLVPLALFTGVWHAHLAVAHRQLLSTNYSGFNLRRAWPEAPLGPTFYETSTRLEPNQRGPDLNTEETAVSSRIFERAVFAYAIANPLAALRQAVRKILFFASAPTSMYGSMPPTGPIPVAYAVLVPAAFAFMIANVALLAFYAVRARTRFYRVLASTENLLLLVALCSALVLALGEANEEARLVLSVLPFLAAFPIARTPQWQ